MLLIATPHKEDSSRYHEHLDSEFELYDIDLYDRKKLDITLKKVHINILIVDMDLFTTGGIHEISELRAIQPKMHIIVITKEVNHRDEISAILFGAKAYCSREISCEVLTKVVKAVSRNEVWVDRLFVTRLLAEIEDLTNLRKDEAQDLDSAIAKLTPRESQIAHYIAVGDSNKQISERLSISERTVKAHLGVIFRKMGLNDRLQLALYMNRYQQLANVWHAKHSPEKK